MVSKKELVLRAFRGEEVDRVPVGFWFHFVSQEEKMLGLDNPVIFNKSVEGHAAYVRAARPDFVKIMSDGFFKYPSALYSDHIESIRDLATIQSIGEGHPWIEQQIEMVKAIRRTSLPSTISLRQSPISSAGSAGKGREEIEKLQIFWQRILS